MLFMRICILLNIHMRKIKNVWLTTVVQESKGLDISPFFLPVYILLHYLFLLSKNDHQTILTGDPGGDRCRCCPQLCSLWLG